MSTRRSRLVRLVASCLPFATFLAACDAKRADPPQIQRSLGLTAFENCTDLEQYIEDTAVRKMRNDLDPDNFLGFDGRVALGGNVDTAAGTPTSQSAESAPSAYTKTNTQVQGVDEADFVKTNGTHIFVLSGRKLYVTRSWPASETSLQSELRIEGSPREMFLEEAVDRIVVMSTVGGRYWDPAAPSMPWYCAEWGCGSEQIATKITVVDVAVPEAPAVISEQYVPGRYQNARRVGTSVRIVLDDNVTWPDGLQWWPDDDAGIFGNEVLLRRSLESLMDENEATIRAHTLAQWLPNARRRADGDLVEIAYSCEAFNRVNAPVELGLTTIATLELDDPSVVHHTSIIARTREVYATTDSLYLANQHWWWWPRPGQMDWTYLFKLDISDPTQARLVAAGGVEGHILDQFSMDEHQGNLRVATTIARRVDDDDNPWGRVETSNRVTCLGADLGFVGQTAEVAKGERIYSARFVGDKGFVVTFRQVDPLFTIDLADPSNPRIAGELKVPGFSTYIHPLDEDHLLTIGIHQPEPDPSGFVQWEARAMKLSIFDVSDFANPREKHTQLVGSAYAWSEALYEHKAFNYFAERGVLAIPFSDWRPWESGDAYWNGFVSDVRVFSVDVDAGFGAKGALSMADVYQGRGDDGWSWYWSPWVRRSVMADDYVYAISNAGIRAAHVDALNVPLATVEFERALQTP